MTKSNTDKSDIAILIPARMASLRLPGKPLALINGTPMITHVWARAAQSQLGRVCVAAAEQEIVDAVISAGGEAVLTDPDLPSGSDRIFAALNMIDPDEKIEQIINVQGDLPVISPEVIARSLLPLRDEKIDIATLVCPLQNNEEREDPNVVKAIVNFEEGQDTAQALDFCRELDGKYPPEHAYHHIGIYAYRRAALRRFVGLDMSERERLRKLEQMRALDNGMRIGAACVDTVPRGVDTPADLEWARAALDEMNNEHE